MTREGVVLYDDMMHSLKVNFNHKGGNRWRKQHEKKEAKTENNQTKHS